MRFERVRKGAFLNCLNDSTGRRLLGSGVCRLGGIHTHTRACAYMYIHTNT